MMSKRQLIERIQGINRSARESFLRGFKAAELRAYLRRLESIPEALPEQSPYDERDAVAAA